MEQSHRSVVQMRDEDGLTFAQIGVALGLTRQGAHQLYNRERSQPPKKPTKPVQASAIYQRGRPLLYGIGSTPEDAIATYEYVTNNRFSVAAQDDSLDLRRVEIREIETK